MDWASLSKEKKQALLLIGMWVVGGVVALYYFVLAPYFASRSTSESELDSLRAKISQAESTMRGDARLRAEFALYTEEFRFAVTNYIVPMENPLSWVTEKVYANARQVGVDVQTVVEVGSISGYWDGAIKSDRTVKPYSVRIVTECSYQQLIDLAEVLEKSNPALCITEISISPQDMMPTKHVLNMTVEYPMWGRKLKLNMLETNKAPEGV